MKDTLVIMMEQSRAIIHSMHYIKKKACRNIYEASKKTHEKHFT